MEIEEEIKEIHKIETDDIEEKPLSWIKFNDDEKKFLCACEAIVNWIVDDIIESAKLDCMSKRFIDDIELFKSDFSNMMHEMWLYMIEGEREWPIFSNSSDSSWNSSEHESDDDDDDNEPVPQSQIMSGKTTNSLTDLKDAGRAIKKRLIR